MILRRLFWTFIGLVALVTLALVATMGFIIERYRL